MDGQDGTPSLEIPPITAADRPPDRMPGPMLVAADLPDEPAPPALTARTDRLDLDGGGWMRYGVWQPDGTVRGTVVLLNGRSEYLEKYESVARAWTARGFLAFGLDWRGQGLSSRFLTAPPLRQRGHVRDYAVLLADLDAFLERVVLPRAVPPFVLFGHSMGGHLALRHLLERGAGPFAAAVLSAPMTDIASRPRWVSPALARIAARSAVLSGCATAYAPGQRDYDPAREAFPTNPVTSDPETWAVHHRWYRAVPELVLGGVTFGWLDASFRSIDRLKRLGPPAGIGLPMLVLVPGRDVLVPPESQAALGLRHARCRVVRHDDARHEILMEREEIRRRAWADIDAFLAGALAEPEPEPEPEPAPVPA